MAFDTDHWSFTPKDGEDMHKNHVDRLKVQLNKQIRAFEATDDAQDHARIEKSVKALITLSKAVKEIHATDPKPAKREISRDEEMNDDTEATDLAEYKAQAIAEDSRCANWADWQFKLERKLMELDRNRRDRSEQEEEDQGQGLRTDGERSSA